MPLRIIFAGTPEFAERHLATLLNSEHEVVAVYSQPDRPAGRGRKLTPSPVKKLALAHDIAVEQPLNFKADAAVATLESYQADIMVVVAYGLLLPQVVLEAPRLGCVNVHASLLPRWRGAAPIHRAVLAGDAQTGVTIMQMDIGLDTGDMLVKTQCPISQTDTMGGLHDKLIEQGGPALIEALAQLEAGIAKPEQQDDALANYAHKVEKAEGQIDWQQSAEQIDRQIRGLTPWPGAFTLWQGQNARIHQAGIGAEHCTASPGSIISMNNDGFEVATGTGTLLIKTLQLPGKKAMPVRDILNARRAQFEAAPVFGQ